MAPHASHWPKREPVTIDNLWALHRRLDHTDAFWHCCRLGELIIDTKFDPKAHISHSVKITCGITSNGTKYINFDIPHTKTKADGDRINVSDSTCKCSATQAFENHIVANGDIPPSTPLFSFETADKSWSPMRHLWFMEQCNEIWLKEGLSSAKGHGFCIGGTTHLLLLGTDPWVVMVQGQWTSQSFLSYWRKCKILSLFIGFSFQSCESILSTMSSFKN